MRTCPAVIFINGGIVELERGCSKHNHKNDTDEIQRLKINEKVKNKSKNSCQKPRSIIAEETKKIENENLANLNKVQSLKKVIK
jgi:hypothetical protein